MDKFQEVLKELSELGKDLNAVEERSVASVERKKVCIICSLSSKDLCESVTNFCETVLGLEVYNPFQDQSGSLYRIQSEYLKKIDASDFMIAIPKDTYAGTTDKRNPSTEIVSIFGESTSYELAYARHIGKPVVIWGEGMPSD